tara:strand:- start:256 stop:486 length:231 start_codon:yes stop_codon:yes gene_type:complete
LLNDLALLLLGFLHEAGAFLFQEGDSLHVARAFLLQEIDLALKVADSGHQFLLMSILILGGLKHQGMGLLLGDFQL